MRLRHILPVGALALASLTCAGPKRYTRNEKVSFTLRLWVDDHKALSRPDALKGCEEWLPKGVQCVLAEDELFADVRVSVDDSACVPGDDGKRTLALAYKGGNVTFIMKCFEKADGTYDLHQFRAVMTHEIGHEIGIWNHVPEECDGKDEPKPIKHFGGKEVCGQAVMNRYYDKDVWFVTEIDSLAFDMRDLEYSVIYRSRADGSVPPVERPRPAGPDCVYYGR
jgi:hypothetical protein